METKIEQIIKEKGGIRLDVGCGGNKQPDFVGIDKRSLTWVEIVHDLEVFPWPLPDNCCIVIVASHIIEHIKPWFTLDLFNEMWRILKPNHQLALATPYGRSNGFLQDPTHCNPFIEITFQYFDPRFPLFDIYSPQPWTVAKGFPAWQDNGTLEVLMSKMTEDEAAQIAEDRRQGR
jgi:SAM-dependent methyltransferase